jgi:hypothetical protein
MSTFSAYGMGPKGFMVDRPLNDDERVHHFDVRKPASRQVHYDLSLIKLNSTFVECVDRWYSMRGFLAMAGSVFSALLFFVVGYCLLAAFQSGFWGYLVPVVLALVGLYFPLQSVLADAFTYTHYPIRFNRRNRQVYAFRRDGTVLKAGWDDFYWTIYRATHVGGGDVNVMGHLLDADGVTVKESIALSMVGVAPNEEGLERMRTFFEFFRCYMQDGPGPVLEALKPTPLIMLPGIDKCRESWFFGWEYLTGSAKGFPVFQLLLQVFFLPISLFRWIVMRTSKIPQWPQWVEDECRIDPDDPWVRDERHAAQ